MRSDRNRPFDAFRRGSSPSAPKSDGWMRETYVLPREDARAKARELLVKFPRAAYMTEVEFWQELDDGRIEFTMRRLPSAD
jgi:hypothetical protein